MTPALIYLRVSSQEQARGWSLETQRVACEAYAAEHGYAVVGVYQDVETGATVERGGFQDLMRAIRVGDATILIVYQTDRLHRDLPHAMLTRRELQRLDVEIHTVKRGKSGDTPETVFADNIDDLLAELERARIAERTSRGKRAKIMSGQMLGNGTAPYGYTYVGTGRDRHLEVDPITAPIVQRIFDWYVYGDGQSGPLSANAIAERLTEQHTPSPSEVAQRGNWRKQRAPGMWGRTSVYTILKQSAYGGTFQAYQIKRTGKTTQRRRPKKDHIAVPVPAIIEPGVWERAQQRLSEGKAQSTRQVKHPYLLGRRIRCACGYGVHGRVSGATDDRRRLWYLCNGRIKRLTARPCAVGLPWFRAEATDKAVWEWLRGILESDVKLEQYIHDQQHLDQQSRSPLATRQDIEARLAKLDREYTRILDLYQAEEIDRQEWRKRKAAIDNQRAALSVQLAELDKEAPPAPAMPDDVAAAIRALAADVRPRLPLATFADQRRLIEALQVHVTLSHKDGKHLAAVESLIGKETLTIEW